MSFLYKYFFTGWITATVLLIIGYIVSFVVIGGSNFLLLLNILNGLFLLISLVFKEKIRLMLIGIGNLSESIDNGSIGYGPYQQSKKELISSYFLAAVIVTASLYFLFLAFSNSQNYYRLIAEDGPVEYASSLLWFLAAGILLIAYLRSSSDRVRPFSYPFYPLLIAFFVVCGGEEISWGQRIFDLDTPDVLKMVNVQNEITLHNIGSISVFSNMFFLITLCFFLGIPFLVKKYVQLEQIAVHLVFPVARRNVSSIYLICLVAWVIIGIRFGTLGFHPFSLYEENYYTQMDDEVFELFAAYCFFSFSIFEYFSNVQPRLKSNEAYTAQEKKSE